MTRRFNRWNQKRIQNWLPCEIWFKIFEKAKKVERKKLSVCSKLHAAIYTEMKKQEVIIWYFSLILPSQWKIKCYLWIRGFQISMNKNHFRIFGPSPRLICQFESGKQFVYNLNQDYMDIPSIPQLIRLIQMIDCDNYLPCVTISDDGHHFYHEEDITTSDLLRTPIVLSMLQSKSRRKRIRKQMYQKTDNTSLIFEKKHFENKFIKQQNKLCKHNKTYR